MVKYVDRIVEREVPVERSLESADSDVERRRLADDLRRVTARCAALDDECADARAAHRRDAAKLAEQIESLRDALSRESASTSVLKAEAEKWRAMYDAVRDDASNDSQARAEADALRMSVQHAEDRHRRELMLLGTEHGNAYAAMRRNTIWLPAIHFITLPFPRRRWRPMSSAYSSARDSNQRSLYVTAASQRCRSGRGRALRAFLRALLILSSPSYRTFHQPNHTTGSGSATMTPVVCAPSPIAIRTLSPATPSCFRVPPTTDEIFQLSPEADSFFDSGSRWTLRSAANALPHGANTLGRGERSAQ